MTLKSCCIILICFVFVLRVSIFIWWLKGSWIFLCVFSIFHLSLMGTSSRAERFLNIRWQQRAVAPAPNGPFIVIEERVSLNVASSRSPEQGWQRSLGGLHKCMMNNWVGEARDCRWHSKAVICLDVSDCFYSLMGALPIKAQFTASHEVASIHPFLPKAPTPAALNGGYFWMTRAKDGSRVPIMFLDLNYT